MYDIFASMSDLSEVLPNFDLKPWKHMTFSLEKKGITTAELISRDVKLLAKTIPLPLREVERMATAITKALHEDLGFNTMPPPPVPRRDGAEPPRKRQRTAPKQSKAQDKKVQFITTLDTNIDQLLGGGIPAGFLTEIVGERCEASYVVFNTQLTIPVLPGRHNLFILYCYPPPCLRHMVLESQPYT